MESWSEIARCVIPAQAARNASLSAGVEPSENVVCVCRSPGISVTSLANADTMGHIIILQVEGGLQVGAGSARPQTRCNQQGSRADIESAPTLQGSMLVIDPGTMRRPGRLRASNARPYKFYSIFVLFSVPPDMPPTRRCRHRSGHRFLPEPPQSCGGCRRKDAATRFYSRRADTRSASGRLLFKTGCGPTRRRCGRQISILRHRCRH